MNTTQDTQDTRDIQDTRDAVLDPDVRAFIEAELRECERVQYWAPGSTRSSWTHELQVTLDATTPEEVDQAINAAKAEQHRLALEVARRLIDPDVLRELLRGEAHYKLYWEPEFADHEDDVLDALDEATTVRELLQIARTYALWVDQAMNGARDGWQVTSHYATVYASMRPLFSDDDYDWVTIDVDAEIDRGQVL